MSNKFTPIIPPAVRFNLARGLQSLADQAAEKFASKLGGHTAFRAAADVVKQAIRDNPDIPDKELTAVDLARDMGILQCPKRTGGGDAEYSRRKNTGDRRRRA